MQDTTYQLVDTHTGRVLGTYTYAQRNRARNRADKLDLAYGSVRYVVRVVFPEAIASN